ncbi:MAG TPA: branched-chain amino acid ABC transporter substrate-binding protein [Rubrivivax sp.]|nr:branched-chain amino acid ABC transporter substrate-binding protein [Rubrivivax sp.]
MKPAQRLFSLSLFAVAALASGGALAQKGETVKIAWIDPLSGLMAPVGQNQLKSFQFFAEHFNKKNPAGVKFEIIGIDNKLSPQETANALKSAIDQGVRYVVQGNGSGGAAALIDGVTKHNERNPGKEVLYVNYAAVDPDFTNSKCNYWHFRLDADTSMKMEALTTFIKDMPEVKKVYLINQNYQHGHQVARYAKEIMARKRPDIQFVGEDLTPLAQTRDFAPYIAKIKASGADSIITGNWGSDLTLLMKAANDAGLNVKFFTYYAGVTGTPTAMGASMAGKVYQASYMHNAMTGETRELMDAFKKKFNDDWYTGAVYHAYALLSSAMAQAKSTEPAKVAMALEGLKVKSFNGEVEMRKTDHQLQQTLYIAVWSKAGAKPNDYSVENTGYNFQPVKTYEPYVSSTPTSCQMKRPG